MLVDRLLQPREELVPPSEPQIRLGDQDGGDVANPGLGQQVAELALAGGFAPLWAPNGRELFFVDAQRRMISLPFTPGPVPKLGERRTLFQLASDIYLWENDYYTPFDVSPDGRRFLMARRVEATTAGRAPLVVVDNWFTELRQRLAGQ